MATRNAFNRLDSGTGGTLTEEERRRQQAQAQLGAATGKLMAPPPDPNTLTDAFTGKLFASTPTTTSATTTATTGVFPTGITQGNLDIIGVKPGAWYNTNNTFYKAGDAKGYNIDEYRDITQPGWREASAALAANHAAAGRVLVDDGKGNRYYAAQNQAVQDAAGVWRPAGTPTPPPAAQIANATGTPSVDTTVAPVEAPASDTAPVAAPATVTPAPTSTTGSTVGADGKVAIENRPLSAEARQALDDLKAILKGASYTADDVMKSQEFTQQADAIRKIAELDSGIANAKIRNQLGAMNNLRSTPAIQALQNSQADFNLRSQAQQAAMIPTMLKTAYDRQQDQLKNAGDFLGTVSDLDETSFNQGRDAFTTTAPYNLQTQAQLIAGEKTAYDRKQAEDAQERADYFALTGQDIPVPARRLIDELLGLKRDSAGVADADNQPRIARANQIRTELQAMGVNPDLFSGNVTAKQAQQNLGTIGKPKDTPDPVKIMNQIIALKRAAAVPGADVKTISAQADALRAQLPQFGIDPAKFGADVALNDAIKNQIAIVNQTPDAAADPVKIIISIIDLKRGSQGVANVDNATRMAQAEVLRSQLSQFGIDPALFGPDVTLAQAEANLRKIVNPPKEVTQKDLNALTIQELDIKSKRLDNEKKESDKEVARLLAIAKADPDSPEGKLAVIEFRKAQLANQKLEAEIAATNALRDQRNRPPEPKAQTTSSQRNEMRGIINGWKSAGNTYEQAAQAIRDNAGDLGDVSLQDALADVAAIYGKQAPSATEARTESSNTFTADVLALQSEGRTYEDVVTALNNMVRAGTLTGLTHAQALDSIDRIYGKGRYEE